MKDLWQVSWWPSKEILERILTSGFSREMSIFLRDLNALIFVVMTVYHRTLRNLFGL